VGIFRWIYQNIFHREYPLILIPKYPMRGMPYATFAPDQICLTYSKQVIALWKLDWAYIEQITEALLEHEYLHLIISKVAGCFATHKFNNVNRFDLSTNELFWMFRDGKTFGHLQEPTSPRL